MEGLVFTLLGIIFYWLSYVSPRTDKFIYFFSAIFFLMGAITGFYGMSDIPVGVFEDHIQQDDTTWTPIYSGSMFFLWVLPMIQLLLSIYLLINFGLNANQNGRQEQ